MRGKHAQRLRDLHGRRRPVPVARLLADLAQEVQIEAGAEANARALGDDRLDLAVGPHDVERFEPSRHQRLVEAVALFRPVEDDPRDAGVIELLQNELRPLFERAPFIRHRHSPSVYFAPSWRGTNRASSASPAARQHDEWIDVDRLHDVGQILGDTAERDQRVDHGVGIERRGAAIAAQQPRRMGACDHGARLVGADAAAPRRPRPWSAREARRRCRPSRRGPSRDRDAGQAPVPSRRRSAGRPAWHRADRRPARRTLSTMRS